MTPTQKLIEAAEAAVEALESCDAKAPEDGGRQWYDETLVGPAIDALRAALQGPRQAQAEPVAWIGPVWQLMPHDVFVAWRDKYPDQGHERFRPLYATPPTTDAPAQAASGGEVVAFDDCRISLVTALHMLASDFENALYKFDGDDEARRAANGSIARARKVAARWNWNGATPASAPPAGDPRAPAAAREVVEALRDYAEAAHYFVEAHDNELREAGETRESVRTRMLNAEQDLIRLGYEFGKRAALAAADAQRAQEGGE